MNEDLLKYNMTAARPLPGQSLTDDPEDRGDWENPPEFTSVEKASEYLFDYIIEDERYEGFMDSLENGFTMESRLNVASYRAYCLYVNGVSRKSEY